MTVYLSSLNLIPELYYPFKFNLEQYHLMSSAGFFADGGGTHTEGNRYELIDGEIIAMSPIGKKHGACVNRLLKVLEKKLGDRMILSIQNSISIPDKSQPQPDLAILKYRDDFYAEALPTPSDIFLIIEVTDSTIDYDVKIKAPLYAAAGISELWIFDVHNKIITGFTQPSVIGYKLIQLYAPNDSLTMLAFPDISFSWQEFFLA
jgi:Uma2 family endonuclease